MDVIRLFLNSKSIRSSRRRTNLKVNYTSQIPILDETNNSNNQVLVDMEDNQSTSSDKLSHESLKSFLSIQLSSTSVFSNHSLIHSDLDTCSGFSTPIIDNTNDRLIVAPNVFELVSNARSFTNIYLSKHRQSSIRNLYRQQHKQSILSSPRSIHYTYPSSLTIRRTKSNRFPDRIRKHSVKIRSKTEKLERKNIQPFQSTYRQRNEEFRKIFKELPIEERLIADYSCAWQKDILVQGRMYLSQNYLCFYANILNWKTSLSLKFQDIVGITREKTAKVIPNAIEIKSNKPEKYFFASFVARDKTYALMFRIWQNGLLNQPISTQELWLLIHESYGDDLDMTTDEEDTYNKLSLNTSIKKNLSKEQIQLNDKYDRITSESINPNVLEQEDDHSSVSSHGEHHTDDDNNISIEETTTINTTERQSEIKFKTQENNSNLEHVEICYPVQCPCPSHLATELINRTYFMSVERLFDCIFGDNDFLVAYRASRRIKDFHAREWQINNETGKRERLCTYKVCVAAMIGSTTVCSNERQIIDCELAKSHYILDAEIRNEGIKYADAFFVAVRYCFVQIGPHKSHLKVTCEVRYVKSLMAIIKTFIEKNAMAALQDSFNDLNNRIELSTLSDVLCSSVKRMDQESSKRSRTLSTSKNNERENSLMLNTTRSLRHQQSSDLTSSINDLSINSQQEESIQDEINSDLSMPDQVFVSKNAFFLSFCLLTTFVLLIVNIFLYMKLNQIDHMTDHLLEIYPSWLNKYSYQQENNDWSSLLKIQEEYYQTQLNNLQSVLLTTHNALENVTNALHELTKLNSQSN